MMASSGSGAPPGGDSAIERKTDSLRPGATPEPIDADEVTGIMAAAVGRLEAAQAATTAAIERATRRLQAETERAIDLARRLSHPPR